MIKFDRMHLKFNLKIFLYTFLALSFVFAAHSLAATDNILLQQKNNAAAGNYNIQNLTPIQFQSVIVSIFDFLCPLKNMPDSVLQGQALDKNGHPIVWIPGGALGETNGLIASLYSPPASGIEYIAQVKNNLLGTPAYAADTGFSTLTPILSVWKSFRDIIYILSSLIFVVMGILIILRVKISPQAVISIQNAIPQIITTLILVTFSYAIAGLLIDLSTFIQALFANSILMSDPTLAGAGSIIGSIPLVGQVAKNIGGNGIVNPSIFTFATMLVIPFDAAVLMGTVIAAMIGSLAGPGGALALGAIGGILIWIVFLVIVLIALIRLFIGLLKVYATIIFKIIVSPLEIGMGAFPGSKIGFNSWIWDMIANLAVFPITFIFLLLANFIIEKIVVVGTWNSVQQFFTSGTNSTLWVPSILGGSWGPAGSIAVFGIGFSTIMLLAKLPEMIPQFIFMIKPSPFGQAIGQEAGGIVKNPIVSLGKSIGGEAATQRFLHSNLGKRLTGASVDTPNTEHTGNDTSVHG